MKYTYILSSPEAVPIKRTFLLVSKVMHDGLSGNPWVQCWMEKEILKSCIIRMLIGKRRLQTMSDKVTIELHNNVLSKISSHSLSEYQYIHAEGVVIRHDPLSQI